MVSGTTSCEDATSMIIGKRKELRALTGLRGFCAFFVMVAHYDFRDVSGAFSITFWHNPAVDIFFVLSGFTMFYVHGPERESLDYRDFMARRIARLWPLCVATFLIALVPFTRHLFPLGTMAKVMQFALDVIRQLLMINCWPFIGTGHQYDGPQWSASVEFFLYIVIFPILYSLSTKIYRCNEKIIAITAFSLMGISFVFYLKYFSPDMIEGKHVQNHNISLLSLSLRGMCGFTAGYLAYYYCRKRQSLAIESWLSDAVSAAFVVLVVGAAFDWWYFQYIAVLAPAIVVCNIDGRSWTGRFLSSGPLHHLGNISYSMYLIHVPLVWYTTLALQHLSKDIGHPLAMNLPGRLLAALLIVPLSIISLQYLERPARIWLYRQIRGAAGKSRVARAS